MMSEISPTNKPLELPTSGGTYERLKDGSLRLVPEADVQAALEPKPEPQPEPIKKGA